ncbi:hypothetical protein ACF05T_21840 [Streptomyces lateritius]|uniref:Uncharacterized protein n=1 Tax=Streptomyces lateritius TaxID=67313 RepID=A0ABW6YG26_9ACTN
MSAPSRVTASFHSRTSPAAPSGRADLLALPLLDTERGAAWREEPGPE